MRNGDSLQVLYKGRQSSYADSRGPAYDLTYSNTYYGEHTTSVDGNGKNPGKRELLAVGRGAGMAEKKCARIADEIRDCVERMLGEYIQ